MSVEIVFETHSTSTDNEAGIATGWLDGALSPRGREQARELGARRRYDGIAAVFTSDLGRAVETARIAFSGSGIPVHRDPRLRECDYGEWNGAAVSVIERERVQRVAEPFPGGESYRQTVERMAEFLADVSAPFESRRILVIGHSATRWALEHLLEGVELELLVAAPFDWQEGWSFVLETASSPAAEPGPPLHPR
jgi:alpha-ribazole phosphatase/probable phosphoglycerate mutase